MKSSSSNIIKQSWNCYHFCLFWIISEITNSISSHAMQKTIYFEPNKGAILQVLWSHISFQSTLMTANREIYFSIHHDFDNLLLLQHFSSTLISSRGMLSSFQHIHLKCNFITPFERNASCIKGYSSKPLTKHSKVDLHFGEKRAWRIEL